MEGRNLALSAAMLRNKGAGFSIYQIGAKVGTPTMSSGDRKDDEADKQSPSKNELFRAMQMRIGQELRARYAVPEELPHELYVLLMRLKEQQHEN
jgi:hypothetical protein